MRRMDRYNEEENTNKLSRADKNKELYQNIGNNTRYTNFTDVANANAFEISSVDRNKRTRENYQKMREYSSLIPGPKVKRELDEFKNIYKEKENRVYDINSVIAEARKNRVQDEEESKRKLKNDKYNILLSMTKEELEEYRKERKEKFTHPDEDELHELIDTITSKTLAGEIDKITSVNLLSELMATSIMDKVEAPDKEVEKEKTLEEELEEDLKITTPVRMKYDDETETPIEVPEDETVEETDEVEVVEDENQDKSFITNEKINVEELQKLSEEMDKEEPKETAIDGVGNADNDFYTRSMDLSDADFEGEMDDEFKEKKMPLPLKIFIIIIVLAVIAVAGYYIYKMVI